MDKLIKSLAAPIVITMGCPSGIGPEIILKALGQHSKRFPPAVVIGDVKILQRARDLTNIQQLRIEPWNPGQDIWGDAQEDVIYVYPATTLSPDDIEPGRPGAETGRASFTYISTAIDMCLSGKASAMVTAPISKMGLKLAGYTWPGHTEILAEKTKTKDFLMMMAGQRLNVTLVTIHVPLSQVSALLSKDRVLKTIEITHLGLKRDFGIKRPRIALCGLNPHAGEEGMFGTEEIDIIKPACQTARKLGIDIQGPMPPDTVFYKAAQGYFDAVVCQYHDQGLIPFKLLHFRDGVNVTLGLPIVRTSVDHGTAYDIAGTGKADASSLVSAIGLAAKIAVNRAKSLLQ